MSDTEAIMWAVEKDPALRCDFCNLTLLAEPPRDDRIDETVDRALAAIPRLRQRVVSAPLRMVPPEFADDPTLDLGYHVRRMAVPAPGDTRALLDACAIASETPLDRSRPLWEFTLFEGLAGGGAALLQKVHHTISDGVGGLRLSLALLDFEADPEPRVEGAADEEEGPVRATPGDAVRAAIGEAAARAGRAAKSVVTGAADVVTHPTELPGRVTGAAQFVGSLQRQALVTDAARSDVMAERSLRRHFEVYSLSLPALQESARAFGGSVNDVYVTGLAMALGRYHARHGSDVQELRMAMPISTRGKGEGSANRFVPTRVVVPIQPARDAAAVFEVVHERLTATKGESALGAVDGFASVASGLPTAMLVLFTRSQTRTIDFAASNLRGSPVTLYLAGARIVANYPFGPRTGTAVNVTMLGYCDELHLGLNVDPAAVRDIPGFLADVDSAFGDVLG